MASLPVIMRSKPGIAFLCLLLNACALELTRAEPSLGAGHSDGAVRTERTRVNPLRVIDGDTLVMNGQTHRLFGIDSPEASQKCSRKDQSQWPCGQAATEFLTRLVEGKHLDCREVPGSRDRHGRQISLCMIDGLDINRQMVANGHAWAYRRYSLKYIDAESQAQAQELGVWQGESTPPWHVRREQGRARAAQQVQQQIIKSGSGCLIKGNISTSGKIFHLPGSQDYDKTSVNLKKGERWFCSVEQAQNAGWRARR